MERKVLVLLSLLALGCRSTKTEVNTKTETHTERSARLHREETIDVDFNWNREDYKLNLNAFAYDFTLKSQDSTQPARIVEYREGKPYREIIAKNAVYTEKKQAKDSTERKQTEALSVKMNALETLVKSQAEQIEKLEKAQAKTRTDTLKVAENLKYLLWLVILFGIAYLGTATGIFSVFKRLLKRG